MITDSKLKPLSPTLRQKKRFIRVKIENSGKNFDFKQVSNSLNGELTYYMGAIDFGKAGVWILKDKFDYDKQQIIIKTATEYKDKVLASLSLINKIEKETVKISVLRVSGTLKGVMKES